MNDEMKLRKAYEYAEKMHKGQMRTGGEEYITHPVAVAEMVAAQGFGIDYQITALFHDLLEDTKATESEIKALGGDSVLRAVKLLTKEKGYIMDEYIAGIKSNPIAKAVKTADRLHNLRSAECCSEEFRRKYIEESKKYYLDFSPEMAEAISEVEKTL